MKERELLQRLVNAVGDCEDTEVVLQITKEAKELLEEYDAVEYYRNELLTLQAASLRAASAAEYLLEDYDKRFPKAI